MGAQGDAESMRASKKITAVLSSFILSILPFLILWAAWSVLPDTIPAHWSGGVVDRWGNKLELLVVPLFSLIGSIAISVYLIVSTRRREFADFSVRMRRDFVACYISSLLLSTTCSVILTGRSRIICRRRILMRSISLRQKNVRISSIT